METIFSRVIWKELGLHSYKIHEEDSQKTYKLILDWVKDTEFKKVEEVLFDLSWLESITYEGYYDAPFYGINQNERSEIDVPDLQINDIGIFMSLFHIACKTQIDPSHIRFMADLLEIYYARIPNDRPSAWNSKNKEGMIL